jgi:hypothetical protein
MCCFSPSPLNQQCKKTAAIFFIIGNGPVASLFIAIEMPDKSVSDSFITIDYCGPEMVKGYYARASTNPK